ncbi:MAG: hypothetical protein Q6366_012265, partial [Candidatus Freyarchaeota archaeon]
MHTDARGTSSLCPECGVKLRRSLRGYRLMGCAKCGMEEDPGRNRRCGNPPQVQSTDRCACFTRSRANASP